MNSGKKSMGLNRSQGVPYHFEAFREIRLLAIKIFLRFYVSVSFAGGSVDV